VRSIFPEIASPLRLRRQKPRSAPHEAFELVGRPGDRLVNRFAALSAMRDHLGHRRLRIDLQPRYRAAPAPPRFEAIRSGSCGGGHPFYVARSEIPRALFPHGGRKARAAMLDADDMRAKAQRCRDLLRIAIRPEIKEQLRQWAEEFEEEAEALEGRRRRVGAG